MLAPENLLALTVPDGAMQNPGSASAQVPGATVNGVSEIDAAQTANFGLTEIKVAHE